MANRNLQDNKYLFDEAEIARSMRGFAYLHSDRPKCRADLPQENEALLAADVLALHCVSCRRSVSQEFRTRLQTVLRRLGVEIDYANPKHRQCITELMTIGSEMLEAVPLLRSADLLNGYRAKIEAIMHTLFDNQPIHDSGWAPPPDVEGREYIIQHLDDATRNQLITLLRGVQTTCSIPCGRRAS